ncbi:protein of unknown function [Paraburkholderia kururiensis]
MRLNGLCLAERTGLEPATPGVTGRYSNRLNYRSSLYIMAYGRRLVPACCFAGYCLAPLMSWRPLGDSNPCTHRERVMS